MNATGATFDVQADSGIFSGAAPVGRIENAGTFIKSGGAGTSTISVELDNDGSLAASSGLLRLSGGDGTATQTGSFGGTGAGIVEFIAGGYNLAAGSSFTGRVDLTGGTLDISVGATVPVAAGTTTTQSGATLTGVGTLLVNGTLVWTSGTQSGTGETHVAPSGTLTRSGAFSTTLSARTIRNEGLFAFSGAGGIFAGTGARIVNAAGGTFDIQGDGGIFEGAAPAARLENAGTLKKSAGVGSSTIAIELDNDGVIEAASGILNVTGELLNFSAATSTLTGGRYVVSAAFRFSNADIVTNAADFVLDGAASTVENFSAQDAFRNLATNVAAGALTVRGGRTLTAPGAFANAGSLTVLTGSTFESTGALTNTGTVAGTGTVKGTATNNGTFVPGVSPGILRVDGPYSNAGGTLAVEIGGTTPGTGHDQLEVLGAITLGGTLQITALAGFTPTQGQSFTIATGTSVTGSFADVLGAELGSGLRYVVQTTATTVVLSVVSNALSVGNATADEGGDATFSVTLSPAGGTTVTVGYATANGTAVAPGDYTAQTGTLTFAPGETTKTVTVPTAEDALDEDDEELTLVLSSPVGASIGDGSGTGQIADDDPTPTLSVADASATEGDGGVVAAGFAVSLSAASGRTVTVGVATQDGTATSAGDDYESATATITFLPGETTKTFNVDVNGDDIAESDETFGVGLTAPVNATVLDGTATGAILDDDSGGADLTVSKSASAATVGVGAQFSYSLSIINQGSGTASSVQLTDDLPAGITLVSATPSAGGSCGTADPVVCTWAALDSFFGASVSIVVTAPATTATLVNTSTVASPDDINPGNNSATATVEVAELADLSVTKTASPAQGAVDEPLTYTVTVRNGTARAAADRIDDVGGAQVHVMYVLPSDRPDRSLDLNGTLAGSVESFQGWLADKTGGQALRLDTYQGALDVTFLRLDQTDAEIAAEGAFVRDLLEDELLAAGFSAPGKLYAVYYDGTSTFACGGGAWPPTLDGNVAAMYLNGLPTGPVPCASNPFATASQPPTYLEFAMLHEVMHTLGFVPTCAPNHHRDGHVSDEPNDLMWAGDGPWVPGGWGAVVLDENNDDYFDAGIGSCLDLSESAFLTGHVPLEPASSSTAATNVLLTDDLPFGFTPGTITPSQGTCTLAGGTVTCELGTIAAGGDAVVTIAGTPTFAGLIQNTAEVTADQADPNEGDNFAFVTTDVRRRHDLTVTKTDDADPVSAGADVTYTVTVRNVGADTATGVVATDTLPAGMSFVSAAGCTAAGQIVTCAVGTLAPGAQVVRTIVARAETPLLKTNTVVVAANEADDNTDDNTATQTTRVRDSALDIARAMIEDEAWLTGASFASVPPQGNPNMVGRSPLAGFPRHGDTFALLTSGDAELADDANTSGGSGVDIGGASVRGDTDRDVTVLKVDLTVPVGVNCLSVNFRFGSDEYPEWKGTAYNDAFIAELDTSTWTTSGSDDHGDGQLRLRPERQPDHHQRRGLHEHDRGERRRDDVRRRDAAAERVDARHRGRALGLLLDLRPG